MSNLQRKGNWSKRISEKNEKLCGNITIKQNTHWNNVKRDLEVHKRFSHATFATEQDIQRLYKNQLLDLPQTRTFSWNLLWKERTNQH